MESACTKLHKD